MPQEAEEEYKQSEHGVVHSEVVEVSHHAILGFAWGLGAAERGRRRADEFAPWAAHGV